MKPDHRNSTLSHPAWAVLSLIFFSLLAFWFSAKTANTPATRTPAAQSTTPPASAWDALLGKTPFAYSAPLPEPAPSSLDGIYARIDPSWPQWWVCHRCADYRSAGGIWKLQFDKGVMRIYYEVTGWSSIASFTVSGERLRIFNDPYCLAEGEYTWKLEGGQLMLEAIDDLCSFNLRAENLSKQTWLSCLPSHSNDVWQKPPGCEDNPATPTAPSPSNLQAAVTVHGGDSRFFEKPADVYAHANRENTPSPEAISVTYHADSIPYGLHRVIWWEGDWIEASTELPFASMGVQFFGDPQIGWARVLFDGVEMWRGNTSAIWSNEYSRHGGYVEISGFNPGKHTIRAESLGFDYRPVTIASFGFSYEGGVESEGR